LRSEYSIDQLCARSPRKSSIFGCQYDQGAKFQLILLFFGQYFHL